MNHVKVGQFVETKYAIGESNDQEVGLGVKSSAIQLRIILHEKVLLHNPPSVVGIFFVVISSRVLPSKQCAVLTDCIYLLRISTAFQTQGSNVPTVSWSAEK